jgi:hypothetical protein
MSHRLVDHSEYISFIDMYSKAVAGGGLACWKKIETLSTLTMQRSSEMGCSWTNFGSSDALNARYSWQKWIKMDRQLVGDVQG